MSVCARERPLLIRINEKPQQTKSSLAIKESRTWICCICGSWVCGVVRQRVAKNTKIETRCHIIEQDHPSVRYATRSNEINQPREREANYRCFLSEKNSPSPLWRGIWKRSLAFGMNWILHLVVVDTISRLGSFWMRSWTITCSGCPPHMCSSITTIVSSERIFCRICDLR